MATEQELRKKYSAFYYGHENLEADDKELQPLVLAHLNDFIDTVINPSLPSGITLMKPFTAKYSDRKFSFELGPYHTITGTIREEIGFEDMITDLFETYKRNKPWIDTIILEF